MGGRVAFKLLPSFSMTSKAAVNMRYICLSTLMGEGSGSLMAGLKEHLPSKC